MGRKCAQTGYAPKTPKHFIEIGMTPREYFDLKVYVESVMALPGFPGYGGQCFASTENREAYRQWLHNVLLQLGPKFFPQGGKKLAWPVDYEGIYSIANQVVRTISYRIKKENKKMMEEVQMVEGEAGNDKMEVGMAGDDEHYGGGPAGNTDVGEDTVADAEGVLQIQMQGKEMMVVEQQEQEKEVTDEEMRAATIELEDLLDSIKYPEALAWLPDLTDGDSNWDGVADFSF